MKIKRMEYVKPRNKKGYFKETEYEKEFPESEGRHSDLCVVCGWSTYPECRSWCHNEKLWLKEQELANK